MYPSGTHIHLSTIDHEDKYALIFRAKNPDCCMTQKLGECYYPNGDRIRVRAAGDQLYRNRGKQLIRLNRQGYLSYGRQAPTGLYCCVVPTKDNSQRQVCVNIVR